MARRRYYRRYRRRHRWSTRLTNFTGSQLAAAGADFVVYQNLAQNPVQDNDTISQLYTVKNIHCTIELQANAMNIIENLQAYVMFIPQGYANTGVPGAYADIPYAHPEWIMAHRYYGSPTLEYTNNNQADSHTPGFPPLRLFTRLARKLDTGDRVVVIILGHNSSTINSATLDYSGLVKFNTKAN